MKGGLPSLSLSCGPDGDSVTAPRLTDMWWLQTWRGLLTIHTDVCPRWSRHLRPCSWLGPGSGQKQPWDPESASPPQAASYGTTVVKENRPHGHTSAPRSLRVCRGPRGEAFPQCKLSTQTQDNSGRQVMHSPSTLLGGTAGSGPSPNTPGMGRGRPSSLGHDDKQGLP